MMQPLYNRIQEQKREVGENLRWDIYVAVAVIIGHLDRIVGRHMPEFYEVWEQINA